MRKVWLVQCSQSKRVGNVSKRAFYPVKSGIRSFTMCPCHLAVAVR